MKHWRRYAGLAVLGTAASLAFLVFPSRPALTKTGNQIMIISTASVRGEVSPCG